MGGISKADNLRANIEAKMTINFEPAEAKIKIIFDLTEAKMTIIFKLT